jgi:hypothetical protein
MNKDEYIDHELRIRMLEHLSKSMNYKLNALITIAITGFAMPMFMKYFGA